MSPRRHSPFRPCPRSTPTWRRWRNKAVDLLVRKISGAVPEDAAKEFVGRYSIVARESTAALRPAKTRAPLQLLTGLDAFQLDGHERVGRQLDGQGLPGPLDLLEVLRGHQSGLLGGVVVGDVGGRESTHPSEVEGSPTQVDLHGASRRGVQVC